MQDPERAAYEALRAFAGAVLPRRVSVPGVGVFLVEPPTVQQALALYALLPDAGEAAAGAVIEAVLAQWLPERLYAAMTGEGVSQRQRVELIAWLLRTDRSRDDGAGEHDVEDEALKWVRSRDWHQVIGEYRALYGASVAEVLSEPWPLFLGQVRVIDGVRAAMELSNVSWYAAAKTAMNPTSGKRDTDGDEALYVQTFRLLCAEAGQNRAAVQQQLMHMARAGLYGDRAQAAMQRTEAFPMPAQQRDSGFLFTDDNGGPFLPVIVASEIQRIATEAGFIEALVTTYDLRPGDTLRVPNLPGIVEPSAVGEGAEIGGKGFDPNKTEVRPKKWGAVVSWTNEVGEQQGAQYVRHLVDAVGTGYGWAVDYSILQADGTATWHSLVGLLTLAGLSEHTLAATKTAFEDFTFDDYLKLWEQPSVGVWRNVRAVLHHHFKFILKRMTDPEGHYIFQPGQDPESGNITYTEAMPSRAESAADTVFGIVGDWRKIIMARHMGIQARLFESGSVKDVAGNVVNLITQDGLALRFIRHWNWTLADAMKPAFGRVKTAAV